MKIFNELLNETVETPDHPTRIVSLAPFATETFATWNMADRVVGVSAWCRPFMQGWERPVVGTYLDANRKRLKELKPDLILTSGGVQRPLALALLSEGYPVYTFPLPHGMWGILENYATLAALIDEVPKGRAFQREWFAAMKELERNAPKKRPRVYVEMWLGSDMRTIGNLNYVNSFFEWLGADNVFGDDPRSYFIPAFEDVAAREPELYFFHTEPQHPVDVEKLLDERGWKVPAERLHKSGIDCGRNIIHEGPSMLETATWLQAKMIDAMK